MTEFLWFLVGLFIGGIVMTLTLCYLQINRITCTPYGVNTHRLLVQGHRVSYEPEAVSTKITETAEENSRVSSWQQQYFDGIYYGVILADAIVLIWVIVRETRQDRRRKEAQNR